MNKRLLKVLSSCALLGTMMLSSGCGGSSGSKDTLLVWTFTDELKIMIEDYYNNNETIYTLDDIIKYNIEHNYYIYKEPDNTNILWAY